jgi:hypothetical protein
MGYYEPRWNAEEQTMIDVMELNGYAVGEDINKEYTVIHLLPPMSTRPIMFRDDTEYGAIRKAFKYWSNGKGSKYA